MVYYDDKLTSLSLHLYFTKFTFHKSTLYFCERAVKSVKCKMKPFSRRYKAPLHQLHLFLARVSAGPDFSHFYLLIPLLAAWFPASLLVGFQGRGLVFVSAFSNPRLILLPGLPMTGYQAGKTTDLLSPFPAYSFRGVTYENA